MSTLNTGRRNKKLHLASPKELGDLLKGQEMNHAVRRKAGVRRREALVQGERPFVLEL